MTVVRPVRFTDDIPAMQAFLEGLGLQTRISSNRPGWVDMAGAAGYDPDGQPVRVRHG